MSVFKSVGIAEGRSFGTGTFYDGGLKIIKDFLINDVGWNLILDDSSDPVSPSFYISNKTEPSLLENDPTQIIYRIGYVVADSGKMYVTSYLGYNSGAFYLPHNYSKIATYDSAEFELHVRSDDTLTFFNISTRTGTTYNFCHYDELDMTNSILTDASTLQDISSCAQDGDTKHIVVEVTDASAFITGKFYAITDTSSNEYINQVTVITVNTVSIPNKLHLEANLPTIPSDFVAGALIGTFPHKFIASYLNYTDGYECYSTPYVYNPRAMWASNAYVRSWHMNEINIYGATIPRIVGKSLNLNLYHYDIATQFGEDEYKIAYGEAKSLWSSDSSGGILSTGYNFNATDYIHIGLHGEDIYVEDGSVVV